MLEGEAAGVPSRTRQAADAETIVRLVKTGDLLIQLVLVPEAHYRYEFPFISEMPSGLRHPDNPYPDSLIYERTYAITPDLEQPARSTSCATQQQPLNGLSMVVHQSMYLKPCHAAIIIVPGLAVAQVSRWTSSTSDNDLLGNLLNAYFLFVYPWYSFFPVDSFLENSMSGDTGNCLQLLVNAVLAAACVSSCTLSDPRWKCTEPP